MAKQVISVTKNRGKVGRPKSAPTAVVRLPVATLETVDKWAAKQEGKPSRSEAIRRLIEIGLSGNRK